MKKQKRWLIASAALLCLLAVWLTAACIRGNQASSALPIPLTFVGEYAQDGGECQPLTKDTKLNDGHAAVDSAGVRTLHQIRRQPLAAAGKIGGGAAKGGWDERGVFAAVSVGCLASGHIDGVVRGGTTKQPDLRRVDDVVSRMCGHGKR